MKDNVLGWEEEGGGFLPVPLSTWGWWWVYALILVGHCRACMFYVVVVSYIWVRVEINIFKQEKYFQAGQSTRVNNQTRIKYSIRYHKFIHVIYYYNIR